MSKANIKYIPIDLFEIDLTIIYGNNAKECYSKFYDEFYDFVEADMPIDPTSRVASAIHCISRRKSEKGNSWQPNFIMVLPKDTNGQFDRSIVHEAVHISWYIIDYINIEIDYEDHEIQSRLVEYIYELAKSTISGRKIK